MTASSMGFPSGGADADEIGVDGRRLAQRPRMNAPTAQMLTRDQTAARVARELEDGQYVDLGIGVRPWSRTTCPTTSSWSCTRRTGFSASAYQTEEETDPELINAGKVTITVLSAPRSSIRAVVRHDSRRPVDVAVLGAMWVSADRVPANWMIPLARWSRAWAGPWIWCTVPSGSS